MSKHRNAAPTLAHMAHALTHNSPNNQPFNVTRRPVTLASRRAKQARQTTNQATRVALQSGASRK